MRKQGKSSEILAVSLLALSSFFLFADQNLLAPNLTQVAREFGFNELERDVKLGGDISLVFWLLGGTVSLGIGWLTDRFPRKYLYVAVLLVGAIPCLLTGFARTYTELFWLRALTGVGIGGALPLTYSMMGDWFGPKTRALATGVIGFSMGLGIGLGQLLAGLVGPAAGWRLPFILVGAPNLLLALVFLVAVREPTRGGREEGVGELIASGHSYGGKLDWRTWLKMFRIPTNLLVFLQGIPGTVPWGVFFIFLTDFYAQDKGYSVEVATLVVTAIGAAAVIGGLAGGFLGNRLYNKRPALLPLLCGTSTLLGIIPVALLLNHPSQIGVENPSAALPILYGAIAGFTITITGSNVRAILLNVNAPETRGSIFSLYNLADDLGKGLGPAIIALLIASFGRVVAFNVANLFWLFCGFVLLAMMRTFPRDERRLSELLAAQTQGRLDKSPHSPTPRAMEST